MLSFFLLILCLNIDALSYGIAYGIKKIKFKIPFILCLSLLSTLMFALPLFFSKYIYMYFDEFVLRIVNAVILIILGIKYILTKPQNFKKIHKKYVKLFKNNKKINNLKNNTLTYYENKILINKIKFKPFYFDNKKSSVLNNSFKQNFGECVAFSVDAIFTALVSGFSASYYLFSVLFYFFTNFLAIFCGNIILYNINRKLKFNLNIFSGLIFIFLGILKIIGF